MADLSKNPHYKMTKKERKELLVTVPPVVLHTQEIRNDDPGVHTAPVKRKKRKSKSSNTATDFNGDTFNGVFFNGKPLDQPTDIT